MSKQIEITEEVINYLSDLNYRPDVVIDELIRETTKLGNVSRMQIAPEQAQFLELLANLISAKNCLEIGRFTGLSTLSLARGIPENGKIIAIDNSTEYLSMAKKYWSKANVERKIESIIGHGVDVLKKLISQKIILDLIFIDADKVNYDTYYELSLQLLKSNGVIIIDNVLWGGEVADENNYDEITKTMRLLNQKIKNDDRINFVLLPQADGILLIRKK